MILKQIILLFLLLLVRFKGFCQEEKEISLIKQWNNAVEDKERFTALQELCRFYLYFNPSLAIEKIQEALLLSKKLHSERFLMKAKINEGFYNLRIDDYDSAILKLTEALDLAKKLNEKQDEAEINQILARVYNGKGQYDVSMKLLLRAQQQFNNANQKSLLGRVYETMGDINDKFGNTKLAIEYLNKSISIKKKYEDTIELSRSYSYLGNVFHRELDYTSAFAYYDTAIDLSIKYLNYNSLSYSYARKANVLLELKKIQEAEEYLNKASTIAETQKNYWLMTRIAVSQSKLFESNNQFELALSKAQFGLSLSTKTKDDEGQSFCYRQLALLYEKTKDYENGFRMLEKLEELESRIWSNNVTSIIATKEIELKNKLEVDQLLKEQEQKELLSKKEKEADKRVLLILIVLIFIVVFFGFYYIHKYRIERKQKKLIAKQSNENYLLLKSFSKQDQNTSLNQISSGIAHEVNSPLSAVQSSAQAIQSLLKNPNIKALTELKPEDIDVLLNILLSNKNTKNYIGREKRERTQFFSHKLGQHLETDENNVKELASKFSEIPYEIEEEDFMQILKSKNILALLSSLQFVGKLDYFSSSSYDAAQRISDKIKELKNYLLLDQEDSISKLHLDKSLQTVIDLFRYETEQKIDIYTHLDKDLVFHFNSSKFYQIIYNILKNAIEAMQNGNKKGEINISAKKDQDNLILKISNNGPVIPEGQIENIFEYFFTTKDGATGLGLAIVKNHLESFNGNIEVNSSSTSTTFTIYLSLSDSKKR